MVKSIFDTRAYEPEEFRAIMLWVSSGKSLRSYCEMEGAPHITTVLRWVTLDPELREQYTDAMKIREQVLFDDLNHISDTPQMGIVTVTENNGRGSIVTKVTETEMTAHRQLQLNTRKWVLSRMNPKKYGDKIQVAGHDAGPLKMVESRMTAQEAAEAYAATLNENTN